MADKANLTRLDPFGESVAKSMRELQEAVDGGEVTGLVAIATLNDGCVISKMTVKRDADMFTLLGAVNVARFSLEYNIDPMILDTPGDSAP